MGKRKPPTMGMPHFVGGFLHCFALNAQNYILVGLRVLASVFFRGSKKILPSRSMGINVLVV